MLKIDPARVRGPAYARPQQEAAAGGEDDTRAVYGWRARIGLIVPSVNINSEPEFYRLVPAGVSVHVARTFSDAPASREHYGAMADGTRDAAKSLTSVAPDLIAYACTSGTISCDREQIKQEMARICKVPVTTTADAVLAALQELGASKVALATPYVPFVVQDEIEFLEREGYRVVSEQSLGLGKDYAERLQLQRTSLATIRQLCLSVDHPEADVIFLSCTGLGALDAIEGLEQKTGKPVITSNQVTFWHCMRMLGFDDRIQGVGSLLALH
ncbi:MAG: aspartate/glutamate racemase family protein [Burkholderiaceae bacterium]